MTTIFFGPTLKPFTGQSVAFDTIASNYEGDKRLFFMPSGEKGVIVKLISNIYVILKVIIYTLLNIKNVQSIYITTSRTLSGFCRDAILIYFCDLLGIKVINHLHGSDFKNFRDTNALGNKIVDRIYCRIDTSIVLLPDMKEQYDMYSEMNVVAIANCFSPFLKESKVRQLVNKESIKILYLSNIMESKGIFYLIEAVDALIKRGLKVELNIAGIAVDDEISDKGEVYRKFNKAIQYKNYIKYHGAVYGKDKENLYVVSDVFILPTFYRTEAQPISLIEGMASGCILISTQHKYVPNLFKQETGYLVDIKSSKAIIDAIIKIDENREVAETMSRFNIKYAEEHYSQRTYVESISKIIQG